METGAVPNVLVDFGEPIPHTELSCPALIQAEDFSPTAT